MAKSTMKTYRAGWSRYQKFTSQFHLAPHPITGEKLTLFIAHVGAQGLAASTIEVYLAGLRLFRLLADPTCTAPPFHTPYVNLLIRGIRRVNAGKEPARIRLPITTAMMNHIRAALASDPHSFQNWALWAACCVRFSASYTAASSWHQTRPFDPQVHLCVADPAYVHDETHNHIEVQIKASKTDQYRQGTRVALGATGTAICPVSALLDYLTIRGNRQGTLFVNENGSPMKKGQFVLKVQQALQQMGVIGHHFNGHSFRIGAATSASQAWVPETTIKILGRWSSMAYQQYIRPSTTDLAAVSRHIAGSQDRSQSHLHRKPPPQAAIARRQQTPSWNNSAHLGHEGYYSTIPPLFFLFF